MKYAHFSLCKINLNFFVSISLVDEEEGDDVEIDQDGDVCQKPGDEDAGQHNSDRIMKTKTKNLMEEEDSHRSEATR